MEVLTAEHDKTRQLSVEQENAICELILGASDTAAAEVAGVRRQTVCSWRNHDAAFAAELKRRREERYEAALELLKRTIPMAVETLAELLKSQEDRIRLGASKILLDRVDLLATSGSSGPAPVNQTSIEETRRILIERINRLRAEKH